MPPLRPRRDDRSRPLTERSYVQTTLNVPGSVTLIPNGDGYTFVGTGTNIFAFFPGDLGSSHPDVALWLLSGHTTYQLDQNFFPVPGTFSHSGSMTDLCAALTR